MPSRPVFRFAPSPNGGLHLGHAYSALLNQRLAGRMKGRLLVRMEDIDAQRCLPALAEGILADLAWLGIEWETPVRFQSNHFADYAAAVGRLVAEGLAYPCFCTRGAVARRIGERAHWPRDPDGSPLYPGTCRQLAESTRKRRMAAGEPFAIRLDNRAASARLRDGMSWMEFREGHEPTMLAADPESWGDAILQRKDIPTSYHIAVVIDDARQAVTDVVRGEDLLAATSLHRLLQTLLGLPAPAYHHHRLVRDDKGEKLSKSRLSPTLKSLRAGGVTPDAIVAALAERGFSLPE